MPDPLPTEKSRADREQVPGRAHGGEGVVTARTAGAKKRVGARAPLLTGLGVLVLGAAAAGLLWFAGGAENGEYALSIEGGRPVGRSAPGDPGGVVRLVPGDRVVITMRADARAEGVMSARVYLFGEGAAPELRVAVEIGEGGGARIAGGAEEMFGGVPGGTWDLCVCTGEASRLPRPGLRDPPPARGDGLGTACPRVEWAPR